MFKYLFVALIARFVASTFEPGRWREIAHVRAKSYGDMIDRMGFKIEKMRRNLKFRVTVISACGVMAGSTCDLSAFQRRMQD